MQHSTLLCFAVLTATAYAAGPVVLMVGPPGSGKSTQARILQKDLGMAVIAADDLIQKNPQSFQKYKIPSLQGVDARQDPAMDALLEQALQSADLSKGVILDGYPASKAQGDFLTSLRQRMGLPSATIIHLAVPDDVVRKRLAGRGGRDVEQELKDYHREFDFIRLYFPDADIHTVDGAIPVAKVAKQIRKIVQSRK